MIAENIPLIEDILSDWSEVIGSEFQGYRNHVYRMVHFCFALSECNEVEREKIIIAGAFHDIGIWVEDTLDYLPPSLPPMKMYLKSRNKESWFNEIALMIMEHHKIRPIKTTNFPLAEIFRKGDLVDFSGGVFKYGISNGYISLVKAKYPNFGFHKNLGKRAFKWLIKNPLRPAPMMKW